MPDMGKDEPRDLFDNVEGGTAKLLRDVALDKAAANSADWIAAAMRRIYYLPQGWSGTGEQLRLQLTADGLPDPHHHNVWGSLIMAAERANLLRDTGKRASMKTAKSHARKTSILRRL